MNVGEFLARADIESVALTSFVEAGWIIPDVHTEHWAFDDVDLARVQLVRDLQRDFAVNNEGIDLIIHLVDQIGGLRRVVGHLALAVSLQPQPARRKIQADFRQALAGRRQDRTKL